MAPATAHDNHMSITNEDIIPVIQESYGHQLHDTSESDADGLRAVARALSI